MSSKTFPTLAAFREWLHLEPGETLTFPLSEKSDKWVVNVHDTECHVDSPWYLGRATDPNGALKCVGINFVFSEVEASGVIEFGLNDDGQVGVMNRRRLTSQDRFDQNTHSMVGVINAQPDRVLEPVAVIIQGSAIDAVHQMTAEQRLALYDRVRDALEREAVHELFRWVGAK